MNKRSVTTKDQIAHFAGYTLLIPSGMAVELIKGARGGTEDAWAVNNTRWLADAANPHDAIYRYCFVDSATVADVAEPEPAAPEASSKIDNYQRAVWAEASLNVFCKIGYDGRTFRELLEQSAIYGDDASTALQDLVCDLLHLATLFKWDAADITRRALNHLAYEVKEEAHNSEQAAQASHTGKGA